MSIVSDQQSERAKLQKIELKCTYSNAKDIEVLVWLYLSKQGTYSKLESIGKFFTNIISNPQPQKGNPQLLNQCKTNSHLKEYVWDSAYRDSVNGVEQEEEQEICSALWRYHLLKQKNLCKTFSTPTLSFAATWPTVFTITRPAYGASIEKLMKPYRDFQHNTATQDVFPQFHYCVPLFSSCSNAFRPCIFHSSGMDGAKLFTVLRISNYLYF